MRLSYKFCFAPAESFAVVAGTEPAPNLDHTAPTVNSARASASGRAVHLRRGQPSWRATNGRTGCSNSWCIAMTSSFVDRPTAADPRGKSIICRLPLVRRLGPRHHDRPYPA